MPPRRSMRQRKPPGVGTAREDHTGPDRKLVAGVKILIAYPRPIFFFALVVFRITNALLINTFFQPDEYFQSLEPAWELAFGPSSGAWITWEWREQLRSAVHPQIFAFVYRAANLIWSFLGRNPATRSTFMLYAPKIYSGVITACGDYFTWIFAIKHGHDTLAIPTAALLISLLNPWQWFAGPRTLINSFESALTAGALFFWPWEMFVAHGSGTTRPQGSLSKSFIMAALACVLRAPNVLIWLVIVTCCAGHAVATQGRASVRTLAVLIRQAAIWGSLVALYSAIVDRDYYGEWTLPPLQFLRFNLVQNLAVFYGRNRPDYYLTEGLPLMMTTSLPFASIGLYQVLRRLTSGPARRTFTSVALLRDASMAAAVLVTVAGLSYIPHKEVRFLQPLLPILTWLAAQMFSPALRVWTGVHRRLKALILLVCVVFNVVLAIYASRYHQRGVVDVIHQLRRTYEQMYLPHGLKMDVGFLMPCHSTPWRSHLVWPDIKAWALTCEPPLHMSADARAQYLDEADVFYKNPQLWLSQNMRPIASIGDSKWSELHPTADGRPWPTFLVFFEALEPTMKTYLNNTHYWQHWRGFNSHFHDDSRRQGDVVVWCLL